MNIFKHSNQYHKGLRKATKDSINYLLYIMVVGVLTCLAINHYQFPQPPLVKPLAVRSFTSDYNYKEPTINSDASERDQVKGLISRIWGKDSWTGQNIARCESGFRPTATNHNTNGTVDQGVFQINSVHNMPSMDNAVANISYAYVIYKQQGVNPWYSSRSCWNDVLALK